MLCGVKKAVEQVVLETCAGLTADMEVQAYIVQFDQFHRSALRTGKLKAPRCRLNLDG